MLLDVDWVVEEALELNAEVKVQITNHHLTGDAKPRIGLLLPRQVA